MVDSKKLISLVEKYEKLIYDTADHIWAHPETGYREWKTSAYMEKHFEELGYTLTKAGNIPGFYTDLDTGKPGPKIAILGELDSLIVANHRAVIRRPITSTPAAIMPSVPFFSELPLP